MGCRDLALPEQRNYEYAYKLAYKLACERLAKIDGIEQQCRQVDAQYRVVDSKQVIIVKYLNKSYLISLPEIEILLMDSGEKVPIRDKVLILHYLTSTKGTPLANKLITFKELLGGNAYFPTFSKRTIKPILKNFGNEPRLLVAAAEKLGSHKADYGDVAVTIDAFSRVPITIVLWRGDDEFAPEGSIIFDTTISDYLPTEDIAVLCETITWRLVNFLKESKVPR